MANIFQVSYILQFILRAFSVILLISYMTDFQVQYSECNIKSAAWQMLHCFLPIRLQILLHARDKHN